MLVSGLPGRHAGKAWLWDMRFMGLLGADDTAEHGAATFVRSELFARTFREGMTLVEETANYLDGDGRDASKQLGRDAALAYAGVSMRLTTQLMQIASWLLVLRAVREGDMSLDEAGDEKYRLKCRTEARADFQGDGLPERLTGLIGASDQLYARISRLDADLFTDSQSRDIHVTDAAGQQRALIKAFGKG